MVSMHMPFLAIHFAILTIICFAFIIMHAQAKKKKVDVMDAAEMGVDLTAKNEVLEVYDPPPRKEGIVVESVDELVDKLKNEAGVIQ